MAWLQMVSGLVQGAGVLSETRETTGMEELNTALKMRQAEFDARQQRIETSKLMSRQRAAYGASGVQVETGTPLEFVSETAAQGELQALMTEYGGEAEQRISDFTISGQRSAGLMRAGTSILSSASSARS